MYCVKLIDELVCKSQNYIYVCVYNGQTAQLKCVKSNLSKFKVTNCLNLKFLFMKKLFFSVVALMCFSLSGFANETEPVKPVVSTPIENVAKADIWCVDFDITLSYVAADPDPTDTNLAEITFVR